MKSNDQIIIYTAPDGKVELKTKIENDTIWLRQSEIASLFNIDRTVVTRHLKDIFESGELTEKSNVQKVHIANSDRPVKLYSLDAIISVGYRVNSKKATAFRIWATSTLRRYLTDGYLINRKLLKNQEQKLLEIQKTIALIQEKSTRKELVGQEKELLDIIAKYTKSLVLLQKYDDNTLKLGKVNKYFKYQIEYIDALSIIETLKASLATPAESLFGVEQSDKLKGIIGSINQTFEGEDLYQNIEEKAAHLLYFTIKDHPFLDGNKRIGSLLFIYFLNLNYFLYKKSGEPKINDNALVALALLIAVSNPAEKDNIIKLIINLIQE